jgi:hypothetical protein
MANEDISLPSLTEVQQAVAALTEVVTFAENFSLIPASIKGPIGEALSILTAVEKALTAI